MHVVVDDDVQPNEKVTDWLTDWLTDTWKSISEACDECHMPLHTFSDIPFHWLTFFSLWTRHQQSSPCESMNKCEKEITNMYDKRNVKEIE